jgi:hypothetical protein
MTTGISSLILNTGEGETLFQASGEFWIWKATGETNNGQNDQPEVITLPQAGTSEHAHRQHEKRVSVSSSSEGGW